MNVDSSIAEATGIVLGTLLSLTGFVFAVAVWMGFYLWRHANMPIPPHIQFVESLTAEPEES